VPKYGDGMWWHVMAWNHPNHMRGDVKRTPTVDTGCQEEQPIRRPVRWRKDSLQCEHAEICLSWWT
jgi:hypothetical protein